MKTREILCELKAIQESLTRLTNSIEKNTSAYTLEYWLAEWVQIYKINAVEQSTMTQIDCCIRLHIPSWLKRKRIDKIKPTDIEQALLQIPLSKTRKETYHVLNGAFRQALNNDFVFKNIMDKVKCPKHNCENGMALTHNALLSMMAKVNSCKYAGYYLFILLSGARPGEAHNMCWEDVSFEKKSVSINGTKNVTSQRTIPLFSELEQLLQSMCKNISENKMSGRIFKLSYSRAEATFKHLWAAKHTLKDLRHTFATRCMENNIQMSVISKWMGHAHIDTTANIYTHVLGEFEKQEAEKLQFFNN